MDDTVARPVTVAVRAHGDADDHLRLAVLLAALGSGDAAAACRDPGATWSERLDALESVLRERDRSQLAVFIDPDALDVEAEVENDPDDRWDDATFRRQRGALLSLLLREFARGAWEIHRPEPSVRLTSMLTEGDSKLEDGARAAVTKLESAETRVAPALRPIVRGLVRRQVMSEEEVAEALDEATDVDRLVLVLSYDALTIDAREAACRLAVLRGPQPLNGVAGPFPIGAGEASISRSALDALITSGWVTRARGDRIEMARAARRFLSLRADADKLMADHAIAADIDPQTLEEELEQHHHAIGARAVERAVETARFYGADLRLLAIDLGKRQQKHAEAALAVTLRWRDVGILFGGDVEATSPAKKRGWDGILDWLERNEQLHLVSDLTLVKAAHHGSSNAVCERAWALHAKTHPVHAVVTPFSGAKGQPPHRGALSRIREHARRLSVTTQPHTEGWDAVTSAGWSRDASAAGSGTACALAFVFNPGGLEAEHWGADAAAFDP